MILAVIDDRSLDPLFHYGLQYGDIHILSFFLYLLTEILPGINSSHPLFSYYETQFT